MDAGERLDYYSNVYLLGGILFEIVAGKRPHAGHFLQQCLMHAARNVIRSVDRLAAI